MHAPICVWRGVDMYSRCAYKQRVTSAVTLQVLDTFCLSRGLHPSRTLSQRPGWEVAELPDIYFSASQLTLARISGTQRHTQLIMSAVGI